MNSDLEYDHWILVEFNTTISSFCEQPRRVDGFDKNGESFESIFDMWCRQGNEKGYYIEVKYHCELEPSNLRYSERSARQVENQRNWCELNGFRYEVQTDKEIYKNRILLSNYKKMLPYIDDRKEVIETDQHRILSIIKSSTAIPVGIITEETGLSKQRVKDVIFRLIYNGILESDIDRNVLGSNTVVMLK
jgi:hypothetical protein